MYIKITSFLDDSLMIRIETLFQTSLSKLFWVKPLTFNFCLRDFGDILQKIDNNSQDDTNDTLW
ncbi:MAG TPA: hypothetical protein DCF68_15555 [Cyanothece sp. UBA12306]|nr:hypothetical protein [Cyanothece sp. UBA12306]